MPGLLRGKENGVLAMATAKQIQFALSLLYENGYSTQWMNSRFKDFGCMMRERRGKVEDWLRGMPVSECSELIDRLKSSKPYKASQDTEVKELRESAGPDADVAELRRIAELDGK